MQCMTSANTLHVEVLLRRSEFSLLRVSIYISTTTIHLLSGDSCIIFKTQ